MEIISSWSERLVGLVLVTMGFWGLNTAISVKLHIHRHRHNGSEHSHVHAHTAHGLEQHGNPKAHFHLHAALAVGTLHGLAGSSHILGVLPALMLPTFTDAAAYLAAFGAGTIVSMVSFSAVVGFIST